MDGPRFDTLTRSFSEARSRRGLVRLLGGFVLGGPLAVLRPPETWAKRKRKRKRKNKIKKQPCYSFQRTCPDGSCVSSVAGCCSHDECGHCGGCVGGRCVELPGLCNTGNCEFCDPYTWTCQPSCTGGLTCCGGQCCGTAYCYECNAGACTYRCGNNCCFPGNQCASEPCAG